MIMPNFKEKIETCPTGVGYCTVNDSNLTKIRVPWSRNIEAMQSDLWKAVDRQQFFQGVRYAERGGQALKSLKGQY